jgi:ABC-type branched-subunit amino acid transport system ATPase component
MLQVQNVVKRFGSLKALDEVSLEVEPASIVGLIGPNGSGKSTLFNIISGFYPMDSGEIAFKGSSIKGLTSDQIARKGICRTFQVSRAPERLTVMENMLLAARDQEGESPAAAFLRRFAVSRSEKRNMDKAMEFLKLLRLSELKNEYASNLSGGQKKLLSLGRAFMQEAELILLDEPTAGVNPSLTLELMEAIKVMNREQKTSFLIIEHSMKLISGICDRVIVLNFGEKLAEGRPEEIQKDEKVLEAYLTTAREEQ